MNKIQEQIKISADIIWLGKVRCILTSVITGKQEISEYNNLIPLVGRVAIARRLGGIGLLANEGLILYGAVGTNAAAPTSGSIKLGTALARKLLASTSFASNVITLRTFLTTAEGNGALKEFGLFGEAATIALDSGTMFNHAAINVTKTAAKTLLIEVTVVIT